MLTSIRKVLYLLREESKPKWTVVVLLAVAMTAVETIGAVAVLLLLAVMANPDAALSLPLIGDVRRFESVPTGDQLIVWLAIAVGAFFVFRGLMSLVQLYAESRLAQNAGARLSVRLLSGYLSMPYLLHTQRNSAELIRNALQSVESVTMEAIMPGARMLSNIVLVIGLLSLLFVVDPIATALAFLILVSLTAILLASLFPVLKRMGNRRQQLGAERMKILQQSLHGIREVLLFGRAGFFEHEFARQQGEMARVVYKARVAKDAPRVVIETVLVVSISGFVILSTVGERTSQETLAVMGLFAYTALRLIPAMHRISQSLNSFRYAAPAIDDVYRDVSEAAALRNDEVEDPFVDAGRVGHEILLENVEFRYRPESDLVVADINLRIAAGESIGIVGPTGGGKSTLVDIISGLQTPTRGSVWVDGIDIETCVSAWQRRLGVVPQTVFLVDGTLRENIAFGIPSREIDPVRLQRSVELARLSSFIEELDDGLDTIVGERGVRMSGGQRQRVAIARALYREPAVLIFDEGTSALDNVTEAEFINAVASLSGKHTIISIAHRLTTVQMCDRILLVEAGRISDIGTYDELCARNPFFRRSIETT